MNNHSKLKIWNGRGFTGRGDHLYVCAKSRTDAARLICEAEKIISGYDYNIDSLKELEESRELPVLLQSAWFTVTSKLRLPMNSNDLTRILIDAGVIGSDPDAETVARCAAASCKIGSESSMYRRLEKLRNFTVRHGGFPGKPKCWILNPDDQEEVWAEGETFRKAIENLE